MVLRGEQIQRCGPAGCTLRSNRSFPHEIDRIPRDRMRARAVPRSPLSNNRAMERVEQLIGECSITSLGSGGLRHRPLAK